jgi:hypothetical protein
MLVLRYALSFCYSGQRRCQRSVQKRTGGGNEQRVYAVKLLTSPPSAGTAHKLLLIRCGTRPMTIHRLDLSSTGPERLSNAIKSANFTWLERARTLPADFFSRGQMSDRRSRTRRDDAELALILLRNNSPGVCLGRYWDGSISQRFGLGSQFGLGSGTMTCFITEKNFGVVGLSLGEHVMHDSGEVMRSGCKLLTALPTWRACGERNRRAETDCGIMHWPLCGTLSPHGASLGGSLH